jgi:hypothetical protein
VVTYFWFGVLNEIILITRRLSRIAKKKKLYNSADGGDTFLRNVGYHQGDYRVS